MDPAPSQAVSRELRRRIGTFVPGARLVLVLAVGWLAMACTSTATRTAEPAVIYSGQLDVHLQPYDDKGVCSINIGLRNASGVRQGDANLRLAWFDRAGDLIAENALRLDGLLDGRYDAKQLTLPVLCQKVGRLAVRRAEWDVFEGWDKPVSSVVRIHGVEDTEWAFDWDDQNGLFVGRIQGR